jgi:hypothetical protein
MSTHCVTSIANELDGFRREIESLFNQLRDDMNLELSSERDVEIEEKELSTTANRNETPVFQTETSSEPFDQDFSIERLKDIRVKLSSLVDSKTVPTHGCDAASEIFPAEI